VCDLSGSAGGFGSPCSGGTWRVAIGSYSRSSRAWPDEGAAAAIRTREHRVDAIQEKAREIGRLLAQTDEYRRSSRPTSGWRGPRDGHADEPLSDLEDQITAVSAPAATPRRCRTSTRSSRRSCSSAPPTRRSSRRSRTSSAHGANQRGDRPRNRGGRAEPHHPSLVGESMAAANIPKHVQERR
jgi:hypothetical protein